MENTIRLMYQIYDKKNWALLCQIFATDIVYCRPGHKPLQGINKVISFFEHDRKITNGNHYLHEIAPFKDDYYLVLGNFKGMLVNDLPIDVDFCDILSCHAGKIIYRKTYLNHIAI